MANSSKPETSPRSYTLRLQGAAGNDLWREHLWRTHVAVNRGAQVFGDFLLTFCGGIAHRLADVDADGNALAGADRKNRRIILALSWLSVEDKNGAPDAQYHLLAKGTETALKQILEKQGVSEEAINSWLDDCRNSINAAIREDAVWVNRSAMFDDLQKKWGHSIGRDDVWDFVGRFVKESEYVVPKISASKATDEKKDGEASEENSNFQSEQAKDMAQMANGWLSNRFGGGGGADYNKLSEAYGHIANWAKKRSETIDLNPTMWGHAFVDMAKQAFEGCPLVSQDQSGILAHLSASGRDSATVLLLKNADPDAIVTKESLDKLCKKASADSENAKKKIGMKGERPYAKKILTDIEAVTDVPYKPENGKGRDRRVEYCVMLDHAARKLISRLSWIKNAEAKRQEFEENFKKLDAVPSNARNFLDNYCDERTKSSNAEDAYRIRKAAITGWKKVLAAWKRDKCRSEEARIKTARDLQDDDDTDEKFGDINLFTDLAAEEAKCVWDDYNSEILEDYVKGTQAEYDSKRFKVPAYRHPDPLSHPVFCDFGNSRPGVKFSAHEQFTSLASGKIPKKVGKLRQIILDLINAHDGSIATETLRWQSKRLSRDIGLGLLESGGLVDSKTKTTEDVPRLDRLGQSRLDNNEKKTIGIYTDKDWNARLQISRDELGRIAKIVQKQEDANPFDPSTWTGVAQQAKNLLKHVKWFVSFSPKLRCPAFLRTDLPKYPKGKSIHYGEGRLKHLLPGLRILSVDLGHHFGASCAVWETVSKDELEKAAKQNGQQPPVASDVFFTIFQKKADKNGKNFISKTVYRRIAEDSVPDSCWARLERQFTIKLQGEESKPRPTKINERQQAENFFKQIGWEIPEYRKKNLARMDSLLEALVGAMRLRLRRHGNVIKAARSLCAKEKIVSGNKTELLKTDAEKITSILGALRFLYELRQTRHWNCSEEIERFWKDHFAPLLTSEAAAMDNSAASVKIGVGPSLFDTSEAPKAIDNSVGSGSIAENAGAEQSSQRRKADRKKWDAAFTPVAEILLKSSRASWCETLEQIWTHEDKQIKVQMRELRQIVLPRPKEEKVNGKITSAFRKIISQRGGLSTNRINMIREFYQVSKAFFMRPGGKNEKIAKGDNSLTDYGKQILDTHERLRENRVKQLVSRIVEAALGLGGGFEGNGVQDKNREASCCTMRQFLDRKRDTKVPESRPQFKPVDAVVIEDLDHYRPDKKQTRRESRMLMQWASGKVRDKLKDHCQLYGLFLMQVSAAYTSRQDSRTGTPGMRCVDVPLTEFMDANSFWAKNIQKIRAKKDKERTPTDNLILDLANMYQSDSQRRENKTLRIPKKGGDLFVASEGDNHGIQADLNAAANIGLKALMDCDCPLFFWKIACNSQGKIAKSTDKYDLWTQAKEHVFLPTHNSSEAETKEKASKSKAVLFDSEPFMVGNEEKKGKTHKPKDSGVNNAWRNITCSPLDKGEWLYTKNYWKQVEEAVCEKLRKWNMPDDETPF